MTQVTLRSSHHHRPNGLLTPYFHSAKFIFTRPNSFSPGPIYLHSAQFVDALFSLGPEPAGLIHSAHNGPIFTQPTTSCVRKSVIEMVVWGQTGLNVVPLLLQCKPFSMLCNLGITWIVVWMFEYGYMATCWSTTLVDPFRFCIEMLKTVLQRSTLLQWLAWCTEVHLVHRIGVFSSSLL